MYKNYLFSNKYHYFCVGFIFGKVEPKERSIDNSNGKWHDKASQGIIKQQQFHIINQSLHLIQFFVFVFMKMLAKFNITFQWNK